MTTFLYGRQLNDAVTSIMGERRCRCAVAFWGRGSARHLPTGDAGFRVICNLRTGGTNPFEIEKLPLSQVRQCDALHAKVYIGSRFAIVTSANASANGLGFEGVEQARWIETGVLLDDVRMMKELSSWFDILWRDSREISSGDLQNSKKMWNIRQNSKPTMNAFSDFDPSSEIVPLPYWVVYSDWVINKDIFARVKGGRTEITRLVDEGMEVESGDHDAMRPGTWLVVWDRQNRSDLPRQDKRLQPRWFRTGKIIREAFRYKGTKKDEGWRDVAIESEIQATPPFDLKETGVAIAFLATMERNEFKELRVDTDGKGFYSRHRLMLIREFWTACKERYVSGL